VEGSPGTGSKPEAIYFSGLGYEELVVSGVGDSLDGVEDQRFSDTDRTAQRQTPFGTNVTCLLSAKIKGLVTIPPLPLPRIYQYSIGLSPHLDFAFAE
jgi:hypothetical protein